MEDIQAGGPRRQAALQQLYRSTPARQRLRQYILRNSGHAETAKDVFHDAMVVLDRNIREGKFRGEASLDGYLYSIGRFLWLKRLEKEGRTVLQENPVEGVVLSPDNPHDWMEKREQSGLLQKVLGLLGERCRRLLELWKLSYSMEEIAQELNFSSSAMARKNRYRCHQQLIKQLKEQPGLAQQIKES